MRFLLTIVFVIVAGCTTRGKLVETTISLNPDTELHFVDYHYSESEMEKCKQDFSSCLKNGLPTFGTSSSFGIFTSLPRSHLVELRLRYRDIEYKLETLHMYESRSNKKSKSKSNVQYFYANCFDAKNCLVRGLFSDAAGSYVAEWKIVDGIALRSILTSTRDIVHKFIKNINPPVYD